MLLPDALGHGFDGVRGLERLDLLGEFGNARPFFLPGFWAVAERPALSWSRKPGQFGQVAFMNEGLAETCLIITKLALGDGEVLSDMFAFGAVGTGHSFQGVQDGARSLVLARKGCLAVIAPSR